MSEAAFCERTLNTIKDGAPVPVHIRWLLPERRPTGEWGCRFTITIGSAEYRNKTVYGEDSLQAVQLALMLGATELYLISTPTYWLAPNDDLGFPAEAILDELRAERTSLSASRHG